MADVGCDVQNLDVGDRVVVSPTIAWQLFLLSRRLLRPMRLCQPAWPPGEHHIFRRTQVQRQLRRLAGRNTRIPYANVGLVKLPEHLTNEQAILLSDVFPSGYFGAELAEVVPGDVVAVFGCGPVGAICILMRTYGVPVRTRHRQCTEPPEIALRQGAEAINFDDDNPVHALMQLTRGIGPDRVIDAVGVDVKARKEMEDLSVIDDGDRRIERQRSQVWSEPQVETRPWCPGNAPLQALLWAVDSIANPARLQSWACTRHVSSRFHWVRPSTRT